MSIDFRDTEQRRQQIKRRYNRRFFLGIHVAALLMIVVLQWFGLPLGFLIPLLAVALIPHALYVAYLEYRDWLEHRVDAELYADDAGFEPDGKRKRYEADAADEPAFRLTDDGEIEPVHSEQRRYIDDSPARTEQPSRHKSRKSDKKRRKYDTDEFAAIKLRRRRKFDTDEFDVKKLMKKLKDIVD